jgi:hypothetical protein
MKRFLSFLFIFSLGVGLSIGGFWWWQKLGRQVNSPSSLAIEKQDDNNNFSVSEADGQVATTSLLSLEKEVDVTPDDKYSYGAFCRVNYLPAEDDFFVTFGGANPDLQKQNHNPGFGGAEGGNGYSYKIYSKDFEYTGENGIVHQGGGDAAEVFVNGYLYFLTGASVSDWQIQKIDPVTWAQADSVLIKTDPEHEMLNDMMLAYVNGNLIASSLYDVTGALNGDQKNAGNQGLGTHNRIFDLDMKQKDYFILDDIPHINGSYVVFVDGVYNYVTSTSFFGQLIVMRYNDSWKYLDSKILDPDGQWSQGALYDGASGRFYVAFVDTTVRNGKFNPFLPPNIALGIFDKNWNLLEKINVTGYTQADGKMPGRPSVVMFNNKLYISYDVASASGPDHQEKFDWQCQVKIFDLIGE